MWDSFVVLSSTNLDLRGILGESEAKLEINF